MKYNNLTIDQKINIKYLISNKKNRYYYGIYNDDLFNGLLALTIIDRNYIDAINVFLSKL